MLLFLASFTLYAQHNTTLRPLDIATIEQITGQKGVTNNGEYKLTVPQNDLTIEVDGVRRNCYRCIPACDE